MTIPPAPLSGPPNYEHLRKQAKALLRACQAGDIAAMERVAPHMSRPPGPVENPRRVRLSDTQLAIARENGFLSWPKLRLYFNSRTTAESIDTSAPIPKRMEKNTMIGKLARIIIFTGNMETMTAFYRDVLGLPPMAGQDPAAADWREFEAGGTTIALHQAGKGHSVEGRQAACAHKISFHCEDVAAERQRLLDLGVPMAEHLRFGSLELCDGPDPEGNRFQLCNRP